MDKDFEVALAMSQAESEFGAEIAACLWNEIDPDSQAGKFLIEYSNVKHGIIDEGPEARIDEDKNILYRDPFETTGAQIRPNPFITVNMFEDEYNEQISYFDDIEAKYHRIHSLASRYADTSTHWEDIRIPLISRDKLKELAKALDERPRFLFPDEIENNTNPEAIDSRKEKTLYCLIAVLAEKSGYSADDQNTVGKIDHCLELKGIKMDKKTIRTHIKEAFKSLNERRE